jgi:hypothetical protein
MWDLRNTDWSLALLHFSVGNKCTKAIITDISRRLAELWHPSAPLSSRGGAGKRKVKIY